MILLNKNQLIEDTIAKVKKLSILFKFEQN